jgi:DNA-binding transcriptional LysR family regulator
VLDLRRLRYFLAVAEERNFTRAAERLHVAQPALSRQVRTLERELGTPLLRRTTHEVELTDAGRELAARGTALVAEADAVWRSVRATASGERGVLDVGYGTSVGYETAPRLLAAVGEQLPGVQVRTHVLPLAAVLAGVADGSLDAGLVRCPPQVMGLEARLVRREPQGVLLRSDHPLAAGESVALGALRGEAVLLHPREANRGHYDAIVALLRAAGVEPDIVLREVAFDATEGPVASGRAITIVGASAGRLLPPGVVWLPLRPEATIEVALVVRSGGRAPAVERLAVEIERASARLGWL